MTVCETKRKIEIVNNEYIRMNITEGEVIAIPNRQKLYKGTLKHLAEIKERNHPTIADMKELYHDFVEGREMPLDTYRIEVTDLQSKQMILDGLLELLLGISDGKIYNVELNPLNFIAEDSPQNKTVYVKAFFREGKELSEITDKWLEDAKKIIGYFLVSDTGYNASNFNSLRPADFLKGLHGNVRDQYLKIMKSPSIDHMAQDWFHPTKYKQIKNFPEMIRRARNMISWGKNIHYDIMHILELRHKLKKPLNIKCLRDKKLHHFFGSFLCVDMHHLDCSLNDFFICCFSC